MGNREDLLAGARQCLLDKGYMRTTARDIATASGVSLAAIGYHFGSKEALLSTAMVEAIRDMAQDASWELPEAAGRAADPIARLEAAWTQMFASLPEFRRLWAVQFEAVAQLDHLPELRKAFVEAQREGRLGLAALLHGLDPAADEGLAFRIGSFYHALLLGTVALWYINPEIAPSAKDLADTLRAIAEAHQGNR